MSYTSPSAEVAEDFAQALDALNLNNRYEISNLTVIAKENTEHAFAISEALKDHIKQTSPQKKLPAFYVLDSIVKNVGTPYTLFFGRQLYSTFMEAYALMDTTTRRKMDEMLKTWKEPVPGSIDTRPVFPPDITRPIETALIKARTSALEAHQQYQRSQPQMGRGRPMMATAPHRDTPTPPGIIRPQMNAPAAPPGYVSNYAQPQYPLAQSYATPEPFLRSQQYAASPAPSAFQDQMNGQQPQYDNSQRPPVQQYPQQSQVQPYSQQPPNLPAWQQSQSHGFNSPESSVEALLSDISNLITSSKADFVQNPADTNIQTRLKALLDLQTILLNQRLPPDQIALIRKQVTQLSEASRPPLRIQTPPAPVPAPASVAAPAPSLNSLLGPGALAALLARQSQSTTPQPPPQPQPIAIKSPPQFPPVSTPSVTPLPNTNALLDRLRAAGLLQSGTAPTSTPPLPQGSLASMHVPPGFPPPIPLINTPPNASRTSLAEIPNDVELKPASLKIPRPHLIFSLYEKLGVPCNQCGRRFQKDEEGKKKKTAHMDWHFRVNQRMTDIVNRGQHRSWYLDIVPWIDSREIDEDQIISTGDEVLGMTSSVVAKPQMQYIPVPDDPANTICPICQEKFEDRWLDDTQEWAWMDTKQIGDRFFHASCYAEATKDSGSLLTKRSTPEPVLGKRKAEHEQFVMRSKIKTEAITE